MCYYVVCSFLLQLAPPPPIWDEPRPVPFFGGGGGGMRAVAFAGAAGMANMDLAAMPMAVPERSLSLGSAPVLDIETVLPKENLAPVTRTRKLFPETWLWEEATVKSVFTHNHELSVYLCIFACVGVASPISYLFYFLRWLNAWFGPVMLYSLLNVICSERLGLLSGDVILMFY